MRDGRNETLTQLNIEVDMLRRIPLFSRIEPAKLKLLAFTSEHVTFQDGQVLMRQGEIGAEAFVLMEGRVAIHRRAKLRLRNLAIMS